MEIVNKKLAELKPYENNPRHNEEAIVKVKNSIERFGFKVPMVIDENNVIVCGHTRYEAAKQLSMQEVPCVIADDLTEAEIKAFRLADNKTAEFSSWDFELLDTELDDIYEMGAAISMCDFGFFEKSCDDFEEFNENLEEKISQKPNSQAIECPNCGFKYEI